MRCFTASCDLAISPIDIDFASTWLSTSTAVLVTLVASFLLHSVLLILMLGYTLSPTCIWPQRRLDCTKRWISGNYVSRKTGWTDPGQVPALNYYGSILHFSTCLTMPICSTIYSNTLVSLQIDDSYNMLHIHLYCHQAVIHCSPRNYAIHPYPI